MVAALAPAPDSRETVARLESATGDLDVRYFSPLAEVPAHVEPALAGEHHVEDDQIGELGGRVRERPLTVADGFDLVSFGDQPVGQSRDEAGLVLDEEDPAGNAAGRGVVFHGVPTAYWPVGYPFFLAVATLGRPDSVPRARGRVGDKSSVSRRRAACRSCPAGQA